MNNHTKHSIVLIFLLFFIACQPDNEQSTEISTGNTLFQKLDPSTTGVDFINEVEDGETFNILTYRNFYNGGGVGIGDINNDGLDDIFFTANLKSNHLYLNKGNLQFEDISEAAGIAGKRGWSTGVSMIDINGDGWLDIYVSNSGDVSGDDRENELFINNGDLTFTEKAAEYNLANAGFTTHASFFDYDADGDLDCYILNNSFKDPSKISEFRETREVDNALGGDRLMRNDGGKFTDVSKEAGIYSSAIGFGLGISVSDVNGDYLPDMYISNDFWERDYLYINRGNGTFSEELTERFSIISSSSMGADIADLNNDGHADIFTTDMLPADNHRLKTMTIFIPEYLQNKQQRANYHYQIMQNCLQINNGQGEFQEMAAMSNADATDWSWGALIFDFENDGKQDIYVCNGIYRDITDQDFTAFLEDKAQVKKIVQEKGKFDFRDFLPYMNSTPLHNYAFVNQGNNQFKNQAKKLGFTKAEFSNGAAYGDLDNDGDLDMVINNVNMVASIYENKANTKGNHYLSVELIDTLSQNRMGIGATVTITTPTQTYTQQHYLARGFQSSVASGLVFGLGKETVVNTVRIVWADGSEQVVTDIEVDGVLKVAKNAGNPKAEIAAFRPNLLLKSIDNIVEDSKHNENVFNDFDYERLLPRMHSTEGPKIEVGDLNGDGKEDLLVLGATGDIDKLFFQTGQGEFKRVNTTAFDADRTVESTAAALFDNDQDGDLDIVIGSGGNDMSGGMDAFLLRYYENDGKGNFTKTKVNAPPAGGQIGVISPFDFDNDGDVDLFVGARSIPSNYGLIPRSFLLRREQNGWKDITEKELGTAGMITDAAWTDFDGDKDMDLMLVGEWMPIRFFANENGAFKNAGAVQNSEGWWLDITPNDIDNDGDMDFVLGNWGYNTKFKASNTQPLTLHVKDFDNNSKSEFILNWTPPGETTAYPFPTKMDLTEQLPSLKKRILKHSDYAKLSYDKLFEASQRKGTIDMKATMLQSILLKKEGNSYKFESLPIAAQVTPTFTSVVDDFNADGQKDIWLGGNFYGLKPEVGRHNSSQGILLLGQTDGQYVVANQQSSPVKGEVRDAKIVNIGNGKKVVIIAVNNAELSVMSYE